MKSAATAPRHSPTSLESGDATEHPVRPESRGASGAAAQTGLSDLERRASPLDNTGAHRKRSPSPVSRQGLGAVAADPLGLPDATRTLSPGASYSTPGGGRGPLLQIQKKHAAARSDACIHKATQPLEGLGPLLDIDMDHFHVIKGQPGERIAIGSKGISSCVALCARAFTALGEPVLGLAHLSSLADPVAALKAMHEALKAEGAVDMNFHVVGGVLWRDENKNWLKHAEDLLDAAAELGIEITSAKLGTAESDPDDQHPDAPLLPSFGLPGEISAVVMPDQVVYGNQSPHASTLQGSKRPLFVSSMDMDGTPLPLRK